MSCTLILMLIYSILIATLCHGKHGTPFRNHHSSKFSKNFWTRISGGYTLKEGEVPSFIGLLGYSRTNTMTSICSGVAISERLVLTAAQCFGNKTSKIVAAPGVWSPLKWQEKGVKTYEVEERCKNSSFDSQRQPPINDYQLLRLKEPIKGISALLSSAPVRIGYKALSVGIGIIDSSHMPYVVSDSLQALPVMRVECDEKYSHPSYVCFQSYNPGNVGHSCIGDAGGPIFGTTKDGKPVVIALTSFGPSECVRGVNGISINTNITYGLQEIRSLANKCLHNDQTTSNPDASNHDGQYSSDDIG